MRLSLHDAKDCKKGSQWYICSANSFKGCCSVDPCGLSSGCPDDTSSATSSSALKPSRTVTLEIIKPSPTTSLQTTITTPAVSQSQEGSRSTVSASGSMVTNAGSVLDGAAQTGLPSQNHSSSAGPSISSKAPIIAGSAAGLVALITISILVWFCVRRRQLRKLSRTSSRSVFDESKISNSSETINDDGEQTKLTDVFTPFGGYHNSPLVQEQRVSQNSRQRTQERGGPIISPVAERESEDVPLPDPEKPSVTPPPIRDHPALHLLPGQSPKVPVYHPGIGVTVSSDLAKSPIQLANHLSLLQEHPALRSSKLGPVSFSSPADSKSHTALKSHHAQLPMGNQKFNHTYDTRADLPSQRRDRKTSISRTASIHNPNTPPYNPTYTTLQSKTRQERAGKSLNKPLSLQNLSSKPKPLLKHSSLPTILSLPSELPADVPQELDGNARPDVTLLSRGDTTSTQTSTYSIPIGLGLENSPSSYVRQAAPLESVVEREPIHSALARKRPSTPPLAPLNTVTSPALVSPEFYPSPQSVFGRSPEISSEQYGHYVVSPGPTTTPTKAASQFTSYHSSPSPPAPGPGPFQTRKYSPLPSPPRRTTKSSPRQRDNVSNTASSSEHTKLPTTTEPQSHSPMPRQKLKNKSSLGKGREHVVAWASYRYQSSGSTSTDPTTPGSTSDTKSLFSPSPPKLPYTDSTQGYTEEPRRKHAAIAEDEDESPILGGAHARLRIQQQHANRNGDSQRARNDQSSAAYRSLPAHDLITDPAGARETDGHSLKSRSRELEERWSGSTVLTSSQAQLLDAAGVGVGVGVGVGTGVAGKERY